MSIQDEEDLLRSTALQNAQSILAARDRAERELREQSELLRTMFEQAAIGIATASLDGRFQRINRRFTETLGYSAEELRGMVFTDITHPDDAEATRERLAALTALTAEEASDYSVETRYLRKDGGLVLGQTTFTVLRDRAGQPQWFIAAVEDITARKRAEEALRRSEQFSRSVIDSSRDCIKTLSLEGTMLWISAAGQSALCIKDPATFIGRSWIEMWHGQDRDAAAAAVATAAAGEAGAMVGCLELEGTPRWWDVIVTPIPGLDGRPERLLAVAREITDRFQSEKALREEGRILELLNRTGTKLASTLDLSDLLQEVTDAATELSGAQFGAFFYNMTDARGDAYMLHVLSGAPRAAFEKLGHPRATPLFGPTFSGGAPIRLDDVLTDPRYGQWGPHHGMPKGHLPVRSYLGVPVISRSGEVIGGLFFGHAEPGVFSARSERLLVGIAAQAAVAIDNARLYERAQKAAAEREQLLDNERSARAEAQRESATKDEFVATLSHELRTPLSAILGWAQILRRKGCDEAERSKGLETIERNARLQAQLIDDLLDMTRIVAGKVRLDVQTLQPASFVEAAIETLKPAAQAKGIRLESVLDPQAGPIPGDPGRLQQVVWNLLSNAIKFTPRGGKVQVLLRRVDSHIEISVTDAGIGISSDFLSRIFQRFRQADSSTTRRHGGLGLGLAISKHLVELHGGTIEAHSPGEHQGATFVVSLPIAALHSADGFGQDAHPRAHPGFAPEFQPIDLSGVQVLVVDDEADTRDVVARVLQECQATVVTAGSAAEALECLASVTPSILLSDIGMPDMDGYELLRRARVLLGERGARMRAIALTAFARSEDRTRALRAGFLVHLAKPVEPAELIATVAVLSGRTADS